MEADGQRLTIEFLRKKVLNAKRFMYYMYPYNDADTPENQGEENNEHSKED